jgi:hypothetical protein
MLVPALSIPHYRAFFERTSSLASRLIERLSASDPAGLAQFGREFEVIVADYFSDNFVHQDYLLTRGTKL